jgi:hypothetical protein
MSYGSEKVKKWRRNTRERIIESLGSMCVCCGCISIPTLDAHHLDPTKKEFSFGKIRANSKSWGKIVDELRKCVLVCSNCHREIHAGIKTVPENPTRFNEKYAVYKEKLEPSLCGKCGKEISSRTINNLCEKCYNISKRKFEITKEELERLVWEKPTTDVAKIFGVTDKAIQRRCNLLEIKKPKRGYWAKLYSQKQIIVS